MKKKLLFTGALICMLTAVAACGGKEEGASDNSVDSNVGMGSSVESVVEDSSVQGMTSETPTTSESGCVHDFTLVDEKAGTCNAKGETEHYVCEECGKKFDLLENEIDSVEGDYNKTNHAGEATLVATAQPTKLTYTVGEKLDVTGLVVTYKCEYCEGEVVNPEYLTCTYQTEADAFAIGDTKVTVSYNGLSFDVEVSVSKAKTEISGVEETYETTCLTAPDIKATANVLGAELIVKYYDASENEVTEESFIAGTTYTAKVSIVETEAYTGAEVTANITVQHGHAWTADEDNWQKLDYQCVCGDKKDYYAMDYQSPYVDEENPYVDLSEFVVGAEYVGVKSVQQIVRMKGGSYSEAKDGEVTEIDFGCDDKMVYTFSPDAYEKPSGEWKPYILTLLVTYDVDGVDCPIVVEVKYVDKLIKTADDLKLLAYTGAASTSEGGTAKAEYYALAGDIDATGLVLPGSKPAWEESIGFCGVLEGNGYTISNLNVAAYANGLFGALGAGAKVQNVCFTNVTMGEDAHLFALVTRKTTFTNVEIEFNVNTKSCTLADTANDSTFTNVSILAKANATPFLKMNDAEIEEIPQGITMESFASSPEVDDPDISDEPVDLLLNAKTKNLMKWDYGNQITVGRATDSVYGDIFTVAVGETDEQSITHDPIKTTGFERVYFYVYNPCPENVRLVVHGGYDGWALATITLPNGWKKVELSVSAFSYLPGQICLVLQDPDAVSVAGEWKITSFYGLKAGETSPEVEAEIALDFGTKAYSGETHDEYGKIYNISREQYYIDNNIANTIGTLEKNELASALPADADHFYFWIYNGTDAEYNFHLAGKVNDAWTDSKDTFTMKAGEWTKIVISAEDIQLNTKGQWHVYILGGDGAGAAKDGWKISTIYAGKTESDQR